EPRAEHDVDRVVALAPAALRAVGLEAHRQRDRHALADQGGGLAALGLVDEVHRAEDVVLPPAPPVGVLLRGLGDRGLGADALAHRSSSATHRLRCTPSPVIVPSMTSPGRSRRPWCRPFPAGLPVSTRSPGSSRTVCETAETIRATPKIMSLVDSSCMTSPLSRSVTCRSPGSPTNAAGTRYGPSGVNVGAFLARSQSAPMSPTSLRNTASRAVMSLAIV